MIGTTLSHYRITEKLGAGGMGEVGRARDTKLNRDVALKVLPEAFSQDAERMARFEREAPPASIRRLPCGWTNGSGNVGRRFTALTEQTRIWWPRNV